MVPYISLFGFVLCSIFSLRIACKILLTPEEKEVNISILDQFLACLGFGLFLSKWIIQI